MIWKEALVCPSVKKRTPPVGVTSREADGVVICHVTVTSVNVPLSLMTVRVVVEGRLWSSGLRGGSAVGGRGVMGQRERERREREGEKRKEGGGGKIE